jgi:predicted enzyme related to lactoylglutathione lyase
MPHVSNHPPGTFCWPELATTDQKGAVAFYRGLFGWEVNEQPIGPTETYSMFQLRGKSVGAAYTMRPEQRQQGVPPHWGTYVSVANADEAARRAQELGAKVLAPPFDVMESGRMAVVQDPNGAVFMVWQAKQHIGAEILGDPGSLCWTELASRDLKAAEKFYTSLFGWTAKHGTDGMEYTELANNGKQQGGILPITPQMGNMPTAWTPYFAVTDVDATAAKAKELGGRVYMGPTDIPKVGRFAVIGDPQGATFDIFKSSR